jgi:hypothetical protein
MRGNKRFQKIEEILREIWKVFQTLKAGYYNLFPCFAQSSNKIGNHYFIDIRMGSS